MAVPLALWLMGQPQLWSAVITVKPPCDLGEAIENANDTSTGQPNADCVAGNPVGGDTLQLTGVVVLTAVDNSTDGPNGLPSVTSEITLVGNGFTIARGVGGAIPDFRLFHVAAGGDLTLDSVTVTNGRIYSTAPAPPSPGPVARGGGIYSLGDLALTNTTVSGNMALAEHILDTAAGNYGHADAGGGGIYVHNKGGNLLITGSTISGNSAIANASSYYSDVSALGAGVLDYYTAGEIVNSTLSGNSATGTATGGVGENAGGTAWVRGGGLFNLDGIVALTHSTLANNTTSASGPDYASAAGGASATSGPASHTSTTLTNSVLASSSGGNCSVNIVAVLVDGGNNIVDDTSCGTIPAVATLGLSPTLTDNGGPTETHALLTGSDAIDTAGDCTSGAGGVTVDQRGVARPVGSACDSGAFEYVGCDEMVLSDDTILGMETFEACQTIRLGPNFAVSGPDGDLTLRAGSRVVLEDGTSVGIDARLSAEIDGSLQMPP